MCFYSTTLYSIIRATLLNRGAYKTTCLIIMGVLVTLNYIIDYSGYI